tara:strand:+ start:196 stop:594 length:399 start_codon:yes stop_codon:yes gene_type:complete
MNKYQKILASLLLALEWSTNNQGNGHSPNRVLRLKNLIEKVEQKIFNLEERGDAFILEDDATPEEWAQRHRDAKDETKASFIHDMEVGRYDRLAPVKWDEVETYNDPNGETSLEEELEQFEFDSKNFNQGDR